MKIIEKCDTRQDTSLQHKHKEITHIGCRRTIKNTRSFTVQYKVFHLLGEKFLSARQGYGGKKEASQQGQRNGIVFAGLVWFCRRRDSVSALRELNISPIISPQIYEWKCPIQEFHKAIEPLLPASAPLSIYHHAAGA